MARTVDQIGRYRVTGELGRGAMGVVYRAEDPAIGRTVAIKTIRLAELTDNAERDRLRERLLREARSAGILSHPGIVTIYDIIEEGDTAYVFMEFVDGQTLEQLLSQQGAMDRHQILELLRLTGEALDYAHGKGIVHRDIKPANLMVNVEGQSKITDFGVAKILSQQLTQAGTIMGTPNYMSPEQIQGFPVDGRSDQFSLAVIAYELVTGEKPYAADSLPTLLYKIVKEAPISPRRLNPTLSAEVDTVLEKAFAKDREGRYGSCTEFASAFSMAVNASPDWQPQMPGSVSDMETVVSPPTLEESDEQATVVAIPTPAPSAEPPAPPSVKERRQEREAEAEKESSVVRNALVMALIVLVVAAGVWAVRYFNNEAPPPLEEAPAAEVKAPETPLSPPPAATDTARPVATPGPETRAEAPVAETPVPTPEPPPPDPPKVVAAKPKPARANPAEHWVQIRSNPPGATVRADNDEELECQTPCELPLARGRHTLRLTLAGHRIAPRIIQVPDLLDVTVNLEGETGTLALTSKPPGATIEINGARRPEKTPAMMKLPAGRYKVRLTTPGREPIERNVEVKDQVMTNIEINW